MNIAYNADCLAAMREMDDECIDLTVTSPPYDSIRDYKGFSFDWKSTLSELYRVTKPGGLWFGMFLIRQLTEVKQELVFGKRYGRKNAVLIFTTR